MCAWCKTHREELECERNAADEAANPWWETPEGKDWLSDLTKLLRGRRERMAEQKNIIDLRD